MSGPGESGAHAAAEWAVGGKALAGVISGAIALGCTLGGAVGTYLAAPGKGEARRIAELERRLTGEVRLLKVEVLGEIRLAVVKSTTNEKTVAELKADQSALKDRVRALETAAGRKR